MARLNARYSEAQPEPPLIWTMLTRSIWSRSFYVAPISLSVFIVIVLWMTRPGELDLGTYIVAWFLSTPVGFLLWVYAWKTNGAGDGHITADVGTTALLGWCAWHRGLYATWVEREFRMGLAMCIVSGIATVCAKAIIGSSTGPITLAMTAASIGTAIPLCVLVVGKASAWQRLLTGRYVTLAWRLLNQPIPLGQVKAFPASFRSSAAQTGNAQASREA